MNLWVFLTIVVLAGVASEVIKEFLRARGRGVKGQLQELESEVARLREQVVETEDLRQRVEVLEDIVTSEDFELERQFSRLSGEAPRSSRSVQAE